MSRKCSKCGSRDVLTSHRNSGDSERRWHTDKPRPATEFVRPNAHSITFVKECLDHHCRTCGYEWETETLDAKETKT